MAELTSTKLNAESHLLLDQPLLRMPYELSRRNFKNAQRVIEHTSGALNISLTSTAKAAPTASPSTTLSSLDGMITRLQTLKRKLQTLHEEEVKIHRSAKARLSHLQDLYNVQSLVDVKYDEWSRVRLSRLLVDYLLREGYTESAACLARSKGIEELVDVDAFRACQRVERSLREGRSTGLALEWCKEHGKELKKVGSKLEFELRFQQYIELVRAGHEGGGGGGGVGEEDDGMDVEDGEGEGGGVGVGVDKLGEATAHAKMYLSKSGDFKLMGRVGGLLAYKPCDEVEPYHVSFFFPFLSLSLFMVYPKQEEEYLLIKEKKQSLYSPSRWSHLADIFLATHHTLYSLPPKPLLHIALSAGLSALKTPACHSSSLSTTTTTTTATTNPTSSSPSSPPPPPTQTTPVCPICSTELNQLARNVPYALHTKSIVEDNPVVLPNGRIYGSERLRVFNEKVGTEPGWVRDPNPRVGGGGAGGAGGAGGGIAGECWREGEVRKVYVM
ncbi:FYV10 [Pyrenophora seminiperda CCB06]|uniref:FYV10 n=1 Tax=Pyrenophora seminiperda CCB06 TaxID=1302712 RepID=A0A3M7M8Y5_9PLEO|nr:FYV10 [Pyrenophora seminiperda CCB06]